MRLVATKSINFIRVVFSTPGIRTYSAVLGVFLFLSSCQEKQQEESLQPRPIKPFTLKAMGAGRMSHYPSIVGPLESTDLSFPVSGTVESVKVDFGDKVKKGDILAVLDPEPFRLNVEAANADLQSSKAAFEAKTLELKRQKSLFDKGWISKATLDRITADHIASKSSLTAARSRLDVRRRDLKKTQLYAPYGGIIGKRDVDAYQNIQAGQKIFSLDGDKGYEARFSVPESLVAHLKPDMEVLIRLPNFEGIYKGTIIELAQATQTANAYDVKARFENAPEGLKSGMTAEVSLSEQTDSAEGYLVPLPSLIGRESGQTPAVYKYNKEKSLLELIPVHIVGIRQNKAIIQGERLQAGDIVVAAGVSFLREGQSVRLPDHM